ncbi:MAG: Hsp70 family protein [Thermodesulfobacteriota bacterium]
MDIEDKRYIIGIDLGTTNSAVSYVELAAAATKDRGIRLFKIPQLTGPGEVNAMPVLPSFCYIPGKYDVSEESIRLPWQSREEKVVGTFARDHGAKVPSRLVSSSKSWLCHSNADRRARILPWGAGEEVGKISPVQATASYLDHIRCAWNSKQDVEDGFLENQFVILTVPASFDEVARDLTLEAAKSAGLTDVILLEEPLSAFYSWLTQHEKDWRDFIAPGELVMVCDVGGGTTDLTLITLRETEGTPRFERIAVGDHLILGGDNIDLALARHVEQQFGGGGQLSGDRWKTLCHLCRQAKENILNLGTEEETITMVGEGSRLIGGTLTAKIDRRHLEQIVLDGFFPAVEKSQIQKVPMRKGISEFGLPYESEPAITRHIGTFLEHHRSDVQQFLGDRDPFPDLILFNGGSLKAGIVQEQVRAAVRQWFGESDTDRPRVLQSRDLDLAVALGASYYGLVKTGKGVRVGSGSPRSYYLGIATRQNAEQTDRQAVCVVERGLDEGSRITLSELSFEVLANQPVSFDLYSSSYRSGDRAGDLVTVDETMTQLPPIQTVIQFGHKGVKTAIPVQIEAEYTETGVLSLWCGSRSSTHRWQLRFQLRDTAREAGIADTAVFDTELVDQTVAAIDAAFSPNADAGDLSGLVKTIAGIVKRSRDNWPLGLIRTMADALLERMEARKLSPEHEIRWLNLTGFCLRPGIGDGFDDQRIKTLWKIYKTGVVFKKNQQAQSEWWILWRRVAAGLNAGRQRQFSQDVRQLLMPGKGAKNKMPAQQRIEIWMAIANMERLAAKEKTEWGHTLLSEIVPKKAKPQQFWSLARIGARELLYGPVDRVIAPKVVAGWIDRILGCEWKQIKAVGAAFVQMARKTGDRTRDLDSATVERVMAWLTANDMSGHTGMLKEVVEVEKQEESTLFGESLPAGLILRDHTSH